MATIRQGNILVHKRNLETHWHVILVSGDTVHLYDPVTEAHKSLNARLLEKYKVWHPPTGVQHVGS